MFDFEKLEVYRLAKEQTVRVLNYLTSSNVLDDYMKIELRKNALNVGLFLAEGTGRFAPPEKKHYYATSRSSIFQCVALLQIMESMGDLDRATYDEWYNNYTTLSKMLLALYRNVQLPDPSRV